MKFFSKLKPAQIISLGFLLIILLGTLVLMMPFSSKTGQVTHLLDAFFTATSATCVTGLTTLPTAYHWSFWGQLAILVMNEVGGLGFMTVVVMLLTLTGQNPSLKYSMVIKESYSFASSGRAFYLIKYIIKMMALIQVGGALLLAVSFVPLFGLTKGLWYSIFHSVSAVSNAGFDLFGNSLMDFTDNPYVLTVMSLLILSGGFGFIIWMDLLNYKNNPKLSLHTRIALVMAVLLVVGGTLLFMIINFKDFDGNILNYLSQNFFLAVSPRTAGFTIYDYNNMAYAGVFLTMVLMFIGGTSGSTSGGIKTTTFGVLLLNIRAILRREEETTYHYRTIPLSTIMQVYEVIFLYMSVTFISLFILLLTEKVPEHNGIEYIIFEVIAAISTAGFSMGMTPDLSVIGKLLIIVLMFVGRIGLFTTIYTINHRDKKDTYFKYPKEQVIVG
ncbi:potassium transporter TrkH [Streptococcaceae bacterium ESL0729]|nr:potassium transporter TrkH [Streptococcaceae bacterium ESL0729]